MRRIEVTTSSIDEIDQLVVRFYSDDISFGFSAAGQNCLSLLTPTRRLDLDRYIFRTSAGVLLEFQHPETGRPALPFSFELQPDHFLPVCLDDAGSFLNQTKLLGDEFTLSRTADVPVSGKNPETKTVLLSDDLLVGTSRNARDIEGRIPLDKFARDEIVDYTFRPFDEQDMERMIAAGFNYFDRVLPAQMVYLYDKPVFFDLDAFKDHPEPAFPQVFYHSGFIGIEDFLDEPGYIFWEDTEALDIAADVTTMARLQEERTGQQFARQSRGRQPGIKQHLAAGNIELGDIDLSEPTFPVWEEFYSTACYQLRVPVSGIIHEGRYKHPGTVDLLNDTFRISLPRTPESMYRFYFAFLRGAARVFDKDWGMSIYGQADRDVSLLGMTMAYDRGARWIFFWSSDRDHHLPLEEQLTLASGLSKHVERHPRGQHAELVNEAENAVVLPYGFTFPISDWRRDRLEDLWHRKQFPLEGGQMADGTPYYSFLRCAAEKMEELVDDDKEFDIVINVPELASAGYTRLHDVSSEARRRAYQYPWWIHYKRQILLAGLVIFWILYRSYRITRWVRLRRKAAADPTGKKGDSE